MSWHRFFRRTSRDAESARDIQFYLETETLENIARGLSPEAAATAARRKFGNATMIREEIYHMNTIGFLEMVLQDARQAWRTMRKNPGFAVTAVLTLALGIGANTAIFTVLRSVLLKPLPYSNPDRLVRVSLGITTVRYEEMRTAVRSFSEIGCYRNFVENVALSGGEAPESLQQARVSANFLHILGVEPTVGRSFRPEEDATGAPPVAMISTDLWRRRFNGESNIAGQTVTLGTQPYTIIGVLPAGFAFPFPGVDVWFTDPALLLRPVSPSLVAFGRLRPGVTVEQASAEAEVLHRAYASAHPGMLDGKLNIVARVVPLKGDLVAKIRALLWMLFGAVSFVLLIACANVASILLARAASRTREFAVRAAIGAGRGRLVGQLLTESALLALGGGVLGVLLARWSLAGIARLSALGLPRTGEIQMDGTVLGLAIALSIATGVLFGLAPALSSSRPDLASMLRAGGAGASAAGPKRAIMGLHPRAALVVGQVALSTVLLIGTALLLESMANLSGVHPGFRPDHLLTMQLSLAPARYDTVEKNAAFFDELIGRIQTLPGIRNAAVSRSLPLSAFVSTPTQPVDRPGVLMGERPLAALQEITPGYFRTLEIPLARGREFTARDDTGAGLVTMINEKFARGRDPVGQQILIGAGAKPVTIVGIVADVHQDLATDAGPAVFRPWAQTPLWTATLVVRTAGDPLAFANTVRTQILHVDPDQPVYNVQSMEDVEEADLGQRRLVLRLLGLFAGIALALTIVGVYGVIAYSVTQRTRELGIRRALGAQQRSILGLVLGEGLGMTLAGVAIGVCGGIALTRVMKAMLFRVSVTDPKTFAGVAVVLVFLALTACYIPAKRAAKIDPMVALRES
jgi:predicted permease